MEHHVQKDHAVMSETVTTQYAAMIAETVESRKREGGLKRAIHETARVYAITERRVRAALYREIRLVEAGEWIAVRARFLDHLEQEAARLDAKAALIRARRNAMREDTV